MTESTKAGRRQFLLLAALFAAPVVAAVSLYIWPELQPQGRTNYGELVTPARPLPEALKFADAVEQPADASAFKGKWSLVYLGSTDCVQSCQDKLFQIRQVRLLLNEKRERVQRIYLAPDSAALRLAQARLGDTHKDLVYLADIGLPGQRAAEFFNARSADAVYIVDPLGNWMMTYPVSAEYKGMLKDIKNLLKLSHIG